MKSNKTSVLLGLVVFAAILAIVSVVYWNSRYVPTTVTEIDFEEYVSEASDNIYRNEVYRFGFQAPDGWVVDELGTTVMVNAPDIESGRSFIVEVTDLAADEYKAVREAEGEYARVFDEQDDVPGYDQGELFKVSTVIGTDDTILFVRHQGRNFIINFHEFNEAHQAILQSFQFLD